MKTKRILLMFAAIMVLVFTGCTSIKYQAGSAYVGFSNDGVKTVQQSKKTSYDSNELVKTFDDEFVYDDEGNIIKHIQTQYYDEAQKFDEYVITYQKIGGVVLPKSAAINGVVYMEIEYDLLPVDHEGRIPEYTSNPVFYRNVRDYLMLDSSYDKWTMDLAVFDVPFRVDGKFVKREKNFDYYSGFDNDSILTIGYDNILLQKFTYSRDKFIEGYNSSLGSDGAFMSLFSDGPDHKNTTFLFGWDVKADKIVQTGVEVVESFKDLTMNFKVERGFDNSGRMTSERWTVTDSEQEEEEPIVLFEEKLTY